MTFWAVVAGVGAGSFAFRLVPLLVLQRATLPAGVDRAIAHAGLAAIAALVGTSAASGSDGSSPAPVAASLVVGAALAVRGAPMVGVIAAGTAVHVGVQIATAIA